MAMNPDDLLIFKVREEDKGASKKDKKAAIQAPQQQGSPVEKAEKPGFFSQKQRQEPQPKQEKRQPPPEIQKPVQKEEKPGVPRAEPARPVEPTAVSESESYYVAPEATTEAVDYVSEAAEFTGDEQFAKENAKKTVLKKREHMDSRKIAQHMSCELHPWRRAYAICDYCKRAFCYEDILEVGGKYYCLDDVDKIPEAVRRGQVVKYNYLGMIASILYMAAFIVFFYYSYNSVLLLVNSIQKIGLPLFITQLDIARELLIAEAILALLAIGTAISILVSSGSSFKLSALVSMVGVGVFGYQYTLYSAIYIAAFAVLTFIAFLLLSYSRVSTESMPEEEAILEASLTGTSGF